MPGSHSKGRPKSARRLLSLDRQAFTRHRSPKYLAAVFPDGRSHAVLILRFSQKHHATSAASSADFRSLRAGFARYLDELFNQRRADARRICLTQLPFLPQQSCDVLPFGVRHRIMHGARNLADALKVAVNSAIAINMPFENFPVVNA